eukprot:c3443_g1_i2.p1 GENE.c3443_g1_i2~~c3443_g1_i2.p1  ORF type:complete len:460 (-),score=39.16 c3443_g1_i2:124-1503(-)
MERPQLRQLRQLVESPGRVADAMRSNPRPILLLVFALEVATVLFYLLATPSTIAPVAATSRVEGKIPKAASVLVMYTFDSRHDGAESNLNFFLLEGLTAPDNSTGGARHGTVRYIILHAWDPLPAAAQTRSHDLARSRGLSLILAPHSSCLSHLRGASTAQHVIFLDSSVRGPFIPSYYLGHWTDGLLALFASSPSQQQQVRAVGAGVICRTDPTTGRALPMLPDWAFAVDRAGLGLMLGSGEARLRCAASPTLRQEAMPALSRAVFAADSHSTIDSLLWRYAGVDWRASASEGVRCNALRSPFEPWQHDGLHVSPFEAMFLPASPARPTPSWTTVETLTEHRNGSASILRRNDVNISIVLLSHRIVSEAPHGEVADALACRGPLCFDVAHYRRVWGREFFFKTDDELRAHFGAAGIREEREFLMRDPSGRAIPRAELRAMSQFGRLLTFEQHEFDTDK